LTDPLKCIPIGTGGNSYLTLNGLERLRNENTSHGGLHVGASTTAAGAPSATAFAADANQKEAWMTHSEFGADLHIADNFRAYGQIDNGTQSGRAIFGPTPSAANRNELSLMALFAEGMFTIDQTKLGLRVGRENASYGSDAFWFAPNGGTNLAGPSFDGVHVYADQGSRRLDLFGYHYVNEVDFDAKSGAEAFMDRDNARELLWGGYFSNDLPRLNVLGLDAKTAVDVFYYGYSNTTAVYTNRNLLKNPASLAIAPGGVSFIKAPDYRHSVGLRYYGALDNFTFDYSGIIQRGSFSGFDVDAWAFHTSTGFDFPKMAWHPWLGVWMDGASGGVSSAKTGGSNTIQTFQPIQQNSYAISTVSVDHALTNIITLSPRMTVRPDFDIGNFHVAGMSVHLWYTWYFRQNQSDAIYNGAAFGNQTGPGVNGYQITAVSRGQFIAQEPNLRIYWNFMPHLSYGLDLAYDFVGPALKAAGAKDTLYVRNQLAFDF
jgi:Alginate export